jgi:predicted SAM-dependent methyltransferase
MSDRPARLHIGSGSQRIPGFLNVDVRPFPGVDVVADVTQGLRFQDVEAVFAEHFLEHLPLGKAVDFLCEVHRVLRADGWLRLSTPNLDWVWWTHYRLEGAAADRRAWSLMLNRAFHGWQHRFLWNREMLEETLAACGFEGLRWCRYGESELPFFRGIERHETWEDEEQLPHVLIIEGRKGAPRPQDLARWREHLQREFLDHVEHGY